MTDVKYKLSGILLLALVLRLMYFSGVVGADDLSLANMALAITEQGFSVPTDHYSGRIGLLFPLAGVLALFGTGDWQLGSLPLVFSLISVALAYLIGKQLMGQQVGLISAFVLAIFPLDVGQATRFFPDLMLGTACALSVFLALKAKSTSNPLPWALLSGLCWGYAYLIKIEAFFLVFVFLTMLVQNWHFWRIGLIICISCGFVFALENIGYFLETGNWLHRLHAIASVKPSIADNALAGRQLWVFPKAWFITPYQFGIHYYLLFAGIVWTLSTRCKELFLIVIWVVIFLAWLQFGFSPFAEEIKFKTHLLRYCAVVSVPMSILVGVFLYRFSDKLGNLKFYSGVAVLTLISLFMINFNSLGSEREEATKHALSYVAKNKLFPIFLDHGSYPIAKFLWRGNPEVENIKALHRYNPATKETTTLQLKDVQGYVLINRDFQRYRGSRYGIEMIGIDTLKSTGRIVHQVDNPMMKIAYIQADFLNAAATLIPFRAVKNKISKTTQTLLKGEDVIIFQIDPSK